MSEAQWLAIAIGNTHVKAAVFQEAECITEYTCQHLDLPDLEVNLSQWSYSWIAIASVVPTLITPWHDLPQTQIIRIGMVPIHGLYSTMGVDRALAVWGAGLTYGYPVLVIDAGTAMTLTGIDANQSLVGGAILPGLSTQLRSLTHNTATLPEVDLPTQMPQRWATDTETAMQSGVIYSAIAGLQAFIQNWLLAFPDSKIVITGGDSSRICPYLYPSVTLDLNLIFWGIRGIWQERGR